MRNTEAYKSLHERMLDEIRNAGPSGPITEVRSAPVEPSGDDETFLMVAGTQSAVMGIRGLRDDLLIPYLNDLIHISRAINQRVASMKD